MVDVVSAAIDNEPQPIAHPTFDMGGALEALSRNDLIPHLANSFLAVASGRAIQGGFFAATYAATGRRNAFKKATTFVPVGANLEVRRERLFPAAPLKHGGVELELLPSERVLPGRLWSGQLRKIVRRPGWSVAEISAWAGVWRNALCDLAAIPRDSAPETIVPGRCIDAVPRNLLVYRGTGQFIDLEWSVDWPLTYADTLYRSVFTPLAALPAVAAPAADVPHSILELFLVVMSSLGCSIDLSTIARAEQSEDRFIECAVGPSLSVRTLRERMLRVR
jgi:hypothetical protein